MKWVLIIALLIHLIALPIVARRLWFLFRLARSAQPAPDRFASAGEGVKSVLTEVFGQRRLLKWTVPGLAHFFTFWAFVILGTVYVEAYGILISRNWSWAIPVIGDWWILGFAQDTIALLVLVSIVVFWWIRMKNAPAKLGRKSRFKGSHEFGAYLVLFFIFCVVWTLFLFRGAAEALDNFHNPGAYVSNGVGALLEGLSPRTLEFLEGGGLILHLLVMLVFLVEVVHSKHLHVLVAPLNVLFKRQPIALGAAKPLMAEGKPVTLDDIEEMHEETTLGVGSIQDFSWKGLLDMYSCTECGRCQSQCPAWNTEKPLSPKLMIMALRDHAYGSGDYLLRDESARESYDGPAREEASRPLVGETEGDPWAPTAGGIIDPDVLWSCVTCGACVQQCPVDIEHVDHIVDMRRYQVLVESNFPAELNQLFKGMESKGNPWNMSASARMDWAKGLDFEVPVVGEDLESLESVDWLLWVGCAGAYEDRAMKTTRAVAELLNIAGVSFGVLGNGETCTGDSARRAGNEFLFQGLAQQNIETFKEYKVKKVVSTCAHCFNTLKNEYKEFGIELEVTHHTQLLNRLVREGKLTPVATGPGAAKRSITYHDPCYIGRHNKVYEPPRELLQVLPGASYVEMERSGERSFCCGAGGARMWMEETIGSRINENRTREAVATGADQIAVGCPFCRVMLSDGLTSEQSAGNAREEVEVLDVAQMLLASVKGVPATRQRAASPAVAPVVEEGEPRLETTAAQPVVEEGEARLETAGGSLFDVAPTEAPVVEEGEARLETTAAPAADLGSGGSLFDVAPAPVVEEGEARLETTGGSLFDVAPTEAPVVEEGEARLETTAKPTADLGSGGSLFDIPTQPAPAPVEDAPAAPVVEEGEARLETQAPAAEQPAQAAESVTPATTIPEGGSLFDIEAPTAPVLDEAPAPVVEEREAHIETTADAPGDQPGDPETILDSEDAPSSPAPATLHSESAEDSKVSPAPASGGYTPATEIPEGVSLFDIQAPEATSAPASGVADQSPTTPMVEEGPTTPVVEEGEARLETTADAPGDQPGDPETILDSEDAPTEPEAAASNDSEPGHTPRKDADISGASSLFDL